MRPGLLHTVYRSLFTDYYSPMSTEAIIAASGYVGIFALMVANGFLSFPSSQVLYILVGYFVSTGHLALLPASLLGALGNMAGCQILYEVVRRHGLAALKKFPVYDPKELRKVEIAFRHKGPWFLFVGKLLPAIKVFVPIPAGLARMRRDLFTIIMLAASWIWSLVFIAIGYFFGKSAELWKSYGIILMIVAATVLFLFYRYLNSPAVLRELEGTDADDKGTQ